jgi:hypothetical protein
LASPVRVLTESERGRYLPVTHRAPHATPVQSPHSPGDDYVHMLSSRCAASPAIISDTPTSRFGETGTYRISRTCTGRGGSELANAVAPDIARLARRLVLAEARGLDRPDALIAASERAWARLRLRLVVLIGPMGCDALFARALALARLDHPILAGVTAETANGSGLADVRGRLPAGEPTDVLDALMAVVAHFLAVLVRLIGADLVVRVVREIWSELPPEEIDLRGETNE